MRPRPLPGPIRHRPFDVHAARLLGVSDERLRRSDLVRPTRGLRWHSADPPIGIDRLRAIGMVLGPSSFISHTSAAELWGLPLPLSVRADRLVHVTSIRPASQVRRPDVVGHHVTAERTQVTRRWGVRASAPAQLFVECGTVLGHGALVAIGDAIVTDARCATTIDDLARTVRRRSGARGIVAVRLALEQVRVGSGSAKETESRLAISDSGLPEPELQVDIVDEFGVFVGRADMAYPAQRIVIEYEGDHHRTDAEQWGRDVRRYREFERLGWTVLRWTRTDLREHRAATMADLRQRLVRAAA